MTGYLRAEMLRTVRDPLYIFQAVIVPIGFYLLFSGLFGSAPHAPGTLSGNVEIMVAMAIFAGIWACLVVTGPRIASDRTNGWLRNLALLPISPWATLAGRTIIAIVFALPAILAVCATGVIVHGVTLSAGEWLAGIALMWLGVWPFALMGVALGYLTNADSAYGVTTGLYFALSAAGGLWIPPSIMPAAMLNIGKLLPSYHAADMGWLVANGQAPTLTNVVVLLVWTLIFLAGAALLAPRAARVR
jgi:ABC-2 type transport system permease protein